jgi:CsbD-like.
MGKIENAKDKAVGKLQEAAGKLTNDQDLQFVGKFKNMTTEVKDRIYDVKEDVVQEANQVLDRANSKLKNKKEQ